MVIKYDFNKERDHTPKVRDELDQWVYRIRSSDRCELDARILALQCGVTLHPSSENKK